MNTKDLDWLVARRPAHHAADKAAHDRALIALLQHTSSRPASRLPNLRFSGRQRSRTFAAAVAAGAAAIAAGVLLSATGSGNPAAGTHAAGGGSSAVISHASTKSPAIRLADQIVTTRASGDATLIQRTTHTGGQDITVYDLYGDNGSYYFAQNESGLPSQVSNNDNQGGGVFGREVAAAKEAATGNVQQAAIAMANAPDPNRNPLITPSSQTPEQAAAARMKEKLTGMRQGPGSLFDNWAWENSQDAMIAGAGDPQVRAGVLQILATLPDVKVSYGTSGGEQTLVLTAGSDEVGANYSEQLTVDAKTGVPIQASGGAPGGSAETTVDYQVKRVTLADVAAGRLAAF